MTGPILPAPVRRTLSLARKETFQIIRDPSSILIAFILPLILLFLFGFGISLDANSIRIGIVVQDGRADARSLIQAFEASSYFDVVTAFDQAELEPVLVSGKLRGLVIIPSDFSERCVRAIRPRLKS